MTKVLIRYTVKPGKAEENMSLVKAVCAELNEKHPEGLRYAAFVAEDGVTFFHMAFIEGPKNPLIQTGAFKAFKKDIADRYDEVAVPTQISELGSFNFFS